MKVFYKILIGLIICFIFYFIWIDIHEIDISRLSVLELKIEEIPEPVKQILISKHQQGVDAETYFEEKNIFICADKECEFTMEIDKVSRSYGATYPPKVFINGYTINLYKEFGKGENPFILYNKNLYFLIVRPYEQRKENVNYEIYGKIDLSDYLD